MAEIKLKNITRTYGGKMVLKNISMTVHQGEITALMGPSGCGKTTLLKIIAGLESPTEGRILFDGRDITEVETGKRNAVIVFQDYRLFPHMTVSDNIEFGLKVRKVSKADRKKMVLQMLEKTRLEGLGNHYPSQISGGQQQRAALARALVIKPEVVLLDEPFSNLDTELKVYMQDFVIRLHRELKFTAVLVTHDREEAFRLASHCTEIDDSRLYRVESAGI